MKKNVVTYDGLTGLPMVSKDVVDSLETNGTYLPDVENVVYNLQTEKRIPKIGEDGKRIKGADGRDVFETVKLDNPVLVTRVWWADGTSTTVRNSAHDRIETETVDIGGRKVVKASDCSKEFGLMAAVVKRTCGVPDDKGEMTDTNMGKIIADIVRHAFDQNVENAKSAEAKARRKAELEAKKAEPKKAKPRKYSQRDLVQMAGPILEKLAAKAAEDPDFVQKLLGAFKGA